ncbi:MAG: phosphoenolpyruvate--protein phosphotransferase [Thermoanaerobaculia bacterium]
MTRESKVLLGHGVSPGIAIGQAVCFQGRPLEVFRIPLLETGVEQEVTRFHRAVAQAQEELLATRQKARDELGEDLVAIFEAQSLLLADTVLLGRVEERIRRERVNAEWAVHKTAEEYSKRFESLERPDFRERKDDLRDVARSLLRALQGVPLHDPSELQSDVIIIAHDLTPSEAVRLGRQRTVAFAVETGGPTSHTAIIARDLGLPMVSGLEGILKLVTDDDPVIVDGGRGQMVLHPDQAELDRTRRQQQEIAEEQARLLATRSLPCVSTDQVEVELMANIDLPEEIEEATRCGAAGVGLYRSEFLYIETSPELPTEEQHYEIYRRLLDEMHPHPVIIRTFDLGGQKMAREMMHTDEEHPVLGLRGIRLTLARPEIFRVQLRALLRAGAGRNLWIMIPMVSTLEEVRTFQAFAEEVRLELESAGLEHSRRAKLGLMIEVPSAALIADLLAREVEFFSIGTNDLIQYALAVDRNNEHVSYLYQPLHPGVLRMIRFIVDSARDAGIDVSMCGEMAADRRHTALLLGLGLRRLSVSPKVIPEIKTQIRSLAMADLNLLCERCLALSTAQEVEEHLERFLERTLQAS